MAAVVSTADTAVDMGAGTEVDTEATSVAVDTEVISVVEVASVRVKASPPAPVLVSVDLPQANPVLVPAPVPVHSADGEFSFYFLKFLQL
jgi:hypothetical protein